MKLKDLSPGMLVHDCHKYKTNAGSTWGTWTVRIISVHETHAVVSWNSNPPERYYLSDIARLTKEKTVLVKYGLSYRKETREEKKERLAKVKAEVK